MFKIRCEPQEKGAFDAVAKASPLLEEALFQLSLGVIFARTCVQYGELVDEEVLLDNLQSFWPCSALRLFKIIDVDSSELRMHGRGNKIAGACCHWRLRRAIVPYIQILGIDYLN